jgi:hypothetical protein
MNTNGNNNSYPDSILSSNIENVISRFTKGEIKYMKNAIVKNCSMKCLTDFEVNSTGIKEKDCLDKCFLNSLENFNLSIIK